MIVTEGVACNMDCSITTAEVIGTIIKGSLVAGWWQTAGDV